MTLDSIDIPYEKLAQLTVQQVPAQSIALALGFSLEELESIRNHDAQFIETYRRVALEEFERNEALSQGWDYVEGQALSIVSKALEITNDRDYALKAAIMANKAIRPRLSGNSKPINGNGVDGNMQAVVQLNVQIVNKIQNNQGKVTKVILDEVPKKLENSMTPKQVHELLENDTDPDDIENEGINALINDSVY